MVANHRESDNTTTSSQLSPDDYNLPVKNGPLDRERYLLNFLPQVSGLAFKLLFAVAVHSNPSAAAWPSRARVMELAGISSKTTFHKLQKELTCAGALTWQSGKNPKTVNTYHLNIELVNLQLENQRLRELVEVPENGTGTRNRDGGYQKSGRGVPEIGNVESRKMDTEPFSQHSSNPRENPSDSEGGATADAYAPTEEEEEDFQRVEGVDSLRGQPFTLAVVQKVCRLVPTLTDGFSKGPLVGQRWYAKNRAKFWQDVDAALEQQDQGQSDRTRGADAGRYVADKVRHQPADADTDAEERWYDWKCAVCNVTYPEYSQDPPRSAVMHVPMPRLPGKGPDALRAVPAGTEGRGREALRGMRRRRTCPPRRDYCGA